MYQLNHTKSELMFRFSYNSEFANTAYSGPIFFSFSLANTTITGCETAACLSKVSLVPYPPLDLLHRIFEFTDTAMTLFGVLARRIHPD